MDEAFRAWWSWWVKKNPGDNRQDREMPAYWAWCAAWKNRELDREKEDRDACRFR